MVIQEGTSTKFVQDKDIAYYLHETRFDTGRLVDINERRKAKELLKMEAPEYHQFIKKVFRTMKKGEIAWAVFSKEQSQGMFHRQLDKLPEEEKAKIGDDIYVKYTLVNIKRNPVCKDNSTFEGRMEFFDEVIEDCKELVQDQEYSNAKDLFARCLAEFKNMPKKMRENLTEEQRVKKENCILRLNLNLALCFYKKSMKNETIKHAEQALEVDPLSAKAHFRIYQAQMINNDFEKAQTSLKKAIEVEPGNKHFRHEWGVLKEVKSKKEREWAEKMSGFYQRDEIQKLEQEEEEEKELREKVWQKVQRERQQELL